MTHPPRHPLRVVVGVVADARGNVLVNQRGPGSDMAGFWEFPGGKLVAGEGPRDGLRRELEEELGVEVLDAEPLMKLSHDYPERQVHLDVWRVVRYRGTPVAREGQPLRWIRPAELPTLKLLPADEPIVRALQQLPGEPSGLAEGEQKPDVVRGL